MPRPTTSHLLTLLSTRCQDVIFAAMLGLAEDAALQVEARALLPPQPGWRFPGFSNAYQDYEPSMEGHERWMHDDHVDCWTTMMTAHQQHCTCASAEVIAGLDHLSQMRTAVHYMLMAPLDDADQTIMLFAGWPVNWCDAPLDVIAIILTFRKVGRELQAGGASQHHGRGVVCRRQAAVSERHACVAPGQCAGSQLPTVTLLCFCISSHLKLCMQVWYYSSSCPCLMPLLVRICFTSATSASASACSALNVVS